MGQLGDWTSSDKSQWLCGLALSSFNEEIKDWQTRKHIPCVAQCLLLLIKFYWIITKPIHLGIVCGCFCLMKIKFSVCGKRPQSLKYLLFDVYKESLQSSRLVYSKFFHGII